MEKNKKGLLALLGLGAGVFAWWKYKNMSQDQKDALKAKVTKTGDKIKDTVADVEGTITEKYDELKKAAKKQADTYTN
ncbi:MAG: YtxH domain-containing protein [Patiriisocius sp.]|uniref:YtxH domain-containing protein n=1 Tax=Patiriisocius sp. TaxID=2822396 RepID=UPI003EF6A7D9